MRDGSFGTICYAESWGGTLFHSLLEALLQPGFPPERTFRPRRGQPGASDSYPVGEEAPHKGISIMIAPLLGRLATAGPTWSRQGSLGHTLAISGPSGMRAESRTTGGARCILVRDS